MRTISTKDKLSIPHQLLNSMAEICRSPFPYYFDDDRKNTALTVGFSVLLVLLMLAVHAAFALKIVISGVATFVVLLTHIVLGPKLLPRLIDAQNWTVGKYMLFTLWQMAVCSVVIPFALQFANIHVEMSLGEMIFAIVPKVIGYGALPVTIATLILQNHMLQESLRNAIRANVEIEKIQKLRNGPAQPNDHLLTIYSDTRETIALHLHDLLFVEASDNYSTFHWKSTAGFEKRILRINLKNVEYQLNNHFMMRCHRSFIVNLNAIVHVSGNANGYKLSIKDHPLQVPVSRAKSKEVITRIEHLRNVIEMN